MKTINITPFLLALSLLVSCSSDDDNGPEVIVPQDATLTLAVAPGSVLTKATEPQEGEAKINNMYAALFKANRTLLTSAYVDFSGQTGDTPDTIRISAKSDTPYTYVILVNVGNIKCSNIDDLKGETYNLKDIRVDNQPMGSKFLEITSLKPGTNYYGKEEIFTNKPADYYFYSKDNIKVYRTASRIDFEKISLEWDGADAGDLLQEKARFCLKQVYVVNAKSTTYLVDRKSGENNYSVETSGSAYLHGKPGEDYLESLKLFPREGDNTSATITSDVVWDITKNPLRCYITENTDKTNPTMLVLKGDILHKDTDTPILSDRYYFIKLLNLIGADDGDKGTVYPGVIRNKVIRISATITGKGSGDEEYKENAYVTVTVTPENWSVETQHEDVN